MYAAEETLDARLCLLESAQTFLWQEREGELLALVEGRLLRARPAPGGWELCCEPEDDAFLRAYFDLDRDYAALAARLTGYPAARRAMELLPGLRVLRQSPWDATIMFLCSQNNNAGRIRSMVLRLCEDFGPRVLYEGSPVYGLPGPEALARVSEEELRERRFGYRARYIAESARLIAREGFPLEEAARLPYGDAKALLSRLPGVGGKVADCALLFGCGHAEAFPVDVWVARLMREWFGVRENSRDKTARRAREMFGEEAGIVQQFLFHCARMGLDPTKKEGL